MTDDNSRHTPDKRSLAQYFFEQGFWSCFAEAMAANDGEPPFEITDAMMERCWQASAIARDDYADFDERLALANSAPEMLKALESIAEATSAEDDAGENYRWDDREGALDYAYTTARAAIIKATGGGK